MKFLPTYLLTFRLVDKNINLDYLFSLPFLSSKKCHFQNEAE